MRLKFRAIFLSVVLGAAALCAPSAQAADAPAPASIFSEDPHLLLVNGYSTSFHWWAFLQRKIDRYLGYKGGPEGRAVEVQSVTKGGTPISGWMDPETGGRSEAWRQMLAPAIQRESGKRPVTILAQQSLQRVFPGGDKTGIQDRDDRERIERGADVLERYAKNLLEDGAAQVVIAMHIYKVGFEPEIGNERLALAELVRRKPERIFAGPDVWTPMSKQHPLAFDEDLRHPNYIGAEIMAHCWFAALLEREGLPVPAWSHEEMESAIENQPLGLTRDREVFAEKLKEWGIARRQDAPQTDGPAAAEPTRAGQGPQLPPRILEFFDKDGDGKLNEEEEAEYQRERERRGRSQGRTPASAPNARTREDSKDSPPGQEASATPALAAARQTEVGAEAPVLEAPIEERLRQHAAFATRKPLPGDIAPPFALHDLNGNVTSLAELLKTKPVLIETGSYTCPVFRGRHGSIEKLYGEYADKIHLVVLYGKEAHPGNQRFKDIAQPARNEERVALAKAAADELAIGVPVLVDDVDNRISDAYGGEPNCGYIIGQDGRVFYKLAWVHPTLMREPLEAILSLGGSGGPTPPSFPVGGGHPQDYAPRPTSQLTAASEAGDAPAPAAPTDKIAWIGEDLAAARALAKKSGAPVLAEFHFEGCTICEAMEKGPLKDPGVVALSRKFIAVRIDLTSEEGLALGEQHSVIGTPTFAVFNPAGDIVARHEGFIEPPDLIVFLADGLARSRP